MAATKFCLASFFGVVALSVDRFLAIHLHLRYQELVTHKRVVVVVILIWVLTVFLSFMISFDIIRGLVIILGVVCLLVTAVVYIRMYLAEQHYKNQIHVLLVQQATENNEITNLSNIIKSAFGTFYVFLLFLFCSLPLFICMAVFQINGQSFPLKNFFFFLVDFPLSQFLFECCNLLLEDETHSTHCH